LEENTLFILFIKYIDISKHKTARLEPKRVRKCSDHFRRT
jgi:hypothetical protein